MSTLISNIITAEPGAKPIMQSLSARGISLLAVGWAAQNLVAWLSLDQSTETTIVAGFLGLMAFFSAMLGVMRRKGIKVPDWLIEILEAVQDEESKA